MKIWHRLSHFFHRRPSLKNAQLVAFLRDTAPLRARAQQAAVLQNALNAEPAGSSLRQTLEMWLGLVNQSLRDEFAYSTKTLPSLGSLWVDPSVMKSTLTGHLPPVQGARFPVHETRPAKATVESTWLREGRPLGWVDAEGSRTVVRSLDAYKAYVAQARRAAGMDRTDGEPVGVHVSFQGSGARGMRYPSAYAEMMALGVVPLAVSGTSGGSLAAALIAAGATPEQFKDFYDHIPGKALLDFQLNPFSDGLLKGERFYAYLDAWLRDLTGIHDRPVTFADLQIPLTISATKIFDSDLPPEGEDLAVLKNRQFKFGKDTPHTPVALAVRASVAVPGFYAPVEMADPLTGRTVQLVDGALVDNLQVPDTELPVVGLSLLSRNSNHPEDKKNKATVGPLPDHNAPVHGWLSNLREARDIASASASQATDFHRRTSPGPNQFMLSLPTWNLNDAEGKAPFLKLGRLPPDPALDLQTREQVRAFFRHNLSKVGNPHASASNVDPSLPETLRFERPIEVDGESFRALYQGADEILFQPRNGGPATRSRIPRREVEAMWLDDRAFGDLNVRLESLLRASE